MPRFGRSFARSNVEENFTMHSTGLLGWAASDPFPQSVENR